MSKVLIVPLSTRIGNQIKQIEKETEDTFLVNEIVLIKFQEKQLLCYFSYF